MSRLWTPQQQAARLLGAIRAGAIGEILVLIIEYDGQSLSQIQLSIENAKEFVDNFNTHIATAEKARMEARMNAALNRDLTPDLKA